jgi:photosynthetic reaction center H subunit
MGTGAITSYVDVAQLVLYAFWIFFFGLIYYLVRENHREGYPMDNDRGILMEGWPRVERSKTYRLLDGREVTVPRSNDGPPTHLNAQKTYRGNGSPIEPTGDPLLAGVGPGSYSDLRIDEPDMDHHGHPKIVPLAADAEYGVSHRDPDPRGKPLVDALGNVAGTVRDLWVDRGEMMFRYLEAEVPAGPRPEDGTRRVLVPVPFARITATQVQVHALMAEQFARVPGTAARDRVTMREEERISAYYGAGLLYAEPNRTEPLV